MRLAFRAVAGCAGRLAWLNRAGAGPLSVVEAAIDPGALAGCWKSQQPELGSEKLELKTTESGRISSSFDFLVFSFHFRLRFSAACWSAGFVDLACIEPRLIEIAYAFEQATRQRVPSSTP